MAEWVRSVDGMLLTVVNRITFMKNLSQYNSVHHKSHINWPEMEPGYPRSVASD
jgi:hypothetical protein